MSCLLKGNLKYWKQCFNLSVEVLIIKPLYHSNWFFQSPWIKHMNFLRINCLKSLSASDLHFEFGDSSLKSEKLLLKCSFLSFEGCDLLLDSAVLCLLEIKMPFHLFLNSHQFVRKTLFDICCFHRQYWLESVFFWSQNLHLLLMIV